VSPGLHLAHAALGVVPDHRAALWNITGGAAVLVEAGGRITDLLGRPFFPLDTAAYRGEPMPFVGGNPSSHAAAVVTGRAALEAPAWCRRRAAGP
jgi:fructose-1,6-bisphosphatase/inositol monophosphatase family enzyme